MTFGPRPLETVTSYDNTAGTGTPVNQVKMEYNDYGLLEKDSQSHVGAVGGGTPSADYTYAGTSTSNSIRRTNIGGVADIDYDYGAANGINDYLSRVQSVVDGTNAAVFAEYSYIGSGNAVRVDYAEPDVMLDLWGGTSGTFTGFDRFGRVIDQHWKRYGGSPATLDRYQYGYDRNSNRIWKQNMVAVTGFDERYIVDDLNRLTRTNRGTLNGSHVIPGVPPLQLAWTLDPVGNWTAYSEQASGSATLLQTRTASTVNEITGITSYITPTWATPAYDDAGNMTSFPRASSPAGSFTATYDAWNRLMSVKQGANFVAEYQYDGLRRRVVKKSYTAGVLSETRDFYFSDQWQILSEAVGGTTDTTYVWGLRYVDELLWRVQSSTRLYAMQDANFNCTAIGNTSGTVVERYQFNPYGTRTVLDASWSVVGASAYNWVVAHQGLMIENDVGLYNCRNRVYSPMLGVWMQRDTHYRDGFNLYNYVRSGPLTKRDPTGLCQYVPAPSGRQSLFPTTPRPNDAVGIPPGPPQRGLGPPGHIPPPDLEPCPRDEFRRIRRKNLLPPKFYPLITPCPSCDRCDGSRFGYTKCDGTGTLCSCVCENDIIGIWGEGPATNILINCIKAHENVHAAREMCGPGMLPGRFIPTSPTGSVSCEEVYAYTAELECLAEAIAEYCPETHQGGFCDTLEQMRQDTQSWLHQAINCCLGDPRCYQ